MIKTLLLAIPVLLTVSSGAATVCADNTTVQVPVAPYFPPRAVTPAQQKAIFNRFVDGFLLTGKPLQAIIDHVADDYIQHNPNFPSGKSVVVAAFGGDLSAFGFTYPANIITRGFDEDRQTGFVHYYFTPAQGAQPLVIADIYRMNGSAVQEHWDVMQARPANATNSLAMFTPPN